MLLGGSTLGGSPLGGSLAIDTGVPPLPPEPLIPSYIDIRFGPTNVTQTHGQLINLTPIGQIMSFSLKEY